MKGNIVHTYDHIVVTAVGNYTASYNGFITGAYSYTYHYYFRDGLPCFDNRIINKTYNNEFITWDEITHARELSIRYMNKTTRRKWWQFWK